MECTLGTAGPVRSPYVAAGQSGILATSRPDTGIPLPIMRLIRLIPLLAGALLLAWLLLGQPDAPPQDAPQQSAALPDYLPAAAHDTVRLIEQGGPFPYRQDGSTFHNRERLLPEMPRGHYREYTVDTPGLGHRGARRIVTGGDPPQDWYYTADHYRSFRHFRMAND